MDRIKDGRDKWMYYQQADPGRVEVVLSNGGGTKYCFSPDSYIQIDSSDNPSYLYPDVFDSYAILHEYGHRLGDLGNFLDQEYTTHSWDQIVDIETAGCEAFAHFCAALITGNAIQRNFRSNFTHYLAVNLENGEWGYDGAFAGSVNNFSNGNEGAVAGELWDLYDNADDDYTCWSGTPDSGVPDGIGDTYDNGLANILNCLTVRNYTSHHPLNITEFWSVWFQSPSLGSPYELWAIWKEHGTNMDNTPPTGTIVINNGNSITASLTVTLALSATDNLSGVTSPLGKMRFSNNNSEWTVWESFAVAKANWNLSAFGGDTMRTTKTTYVQFKDAAGNQSASFSDNIIYRDYICGDANHDHMVNLGDAVYIMNYVFKSGPAPDPLEAGDANCDHAVNAGDAVYIVNYIFKGGPAPCCP